MKPLLDSRVHRGRLATVFWNVGVEMSANYALEKFQSAVHLMATSAAPIQERLRMAYMTFHPARAEDLPTDELKASHRKLMEMLTTVKDAHKGYVPATTEQMTDETAREAAELIYDIAYGIRSWFEDHPDKRYTH
jgi:hypothetical protein